MVQLRKKAVYGFMIVAACAVCPAALRADSTAQVIVTVGEEAITQADLDEKTAMLPPQLRSRYETPAGRRQMLEQVIIISLLSQEARRLGIDKQDDVAKKIKEVADNIIVQELTRQHISAETTVTDEEIARYYEENKDDFVRPEQINASMVMFAVADGASPDEKKKKQQLAEETLKRLKAGADFAEVAREVSEDPRTQRRGGVTGFFAEGRRARIYGKKFEQEVFGLKKGEISDVFETEFGYFVVRVDDRRPRTVEALTEAKSKIERRLLQSKQREAYEAYVEGLKKKYPVKYSE